MRALRYRPAARADIRNLLERSQRRFGRDAQRDYKALIDGALRALCETPDRPGVTRHDGLADGAWLYHLRNARRRGRAPRAPRHIVVFAYDDRTLTVLRVLHDAMDVAARLPPDDE